MSKNDDPEFIYTKDPIKYADLNWKKNLEHVKTNPIDATRNIVNELCYIHFNDHLSLLEQCQDRVSDLSKKEKKKT